MWAKVLRLLEAQTVEDRVVTLAETQEEYANLEDLMSFTYNAKERAHREGDVAINFTPSKCYSKRYIP